MKCPKCGSDRINRNGHSHGRQNYICKQCNRQFLEVYKSRGYSEDAKNICLKMYANGIGFRAIERATGISHNTVINWVKQANVGFLDISQSSEKSDVHEDTELDKQGESIRFREIYSIELNLNHLFLKVLIEWINDFSSDSNHEIIVQVF